MRLSQVARKLNVGSNTIIDFLAKKGFDVESNPNSKITFEQFQMLSKEFASSAMDKEEASGLSIGKKRTDNTVPEVEAQSSKEDAEDDEEKVLIKNIGEGEKKEEAKPKAEEKATVEKTQLQGIKVVGKIDLDAKKPKEEPAKPKAAEPEKKPTPPPVVEETKAVEPPKKEEKVEAKAPEKAAEKAEEKPKAEAPKEKEETSKAVEEEKAKGPEKEPEVKQELIEARADSLKGLTVLGKIELKESDRRKKKKKGEKAAPVASSDQSGDAKKKPRKRIRKEGGGPRPIAADDANKGERKPNGSGAYGKGKRGPGGAAPRRIEKEEPSDKEIQEQIKQTLAKLSGGNKKGDNRSKYRREKRSRGAEQREEQAMLDMESASVLKTTEFISANDLASLMDVSVNEVISKCLQLGMFVSINQRLDAETITIIADEFGFDVEFTDADEDVEVVLEDDAAEDLQDRAPIVTIMGHVDHGKTSLLDYIRKSKVTDSEAGGITQHIGAYDVVTDSGKRVAFLDTPGHEAFTAMRARGAKITDVAIIVVSADDAVMPQTKEAINHAQLAGVPMVIAINKIDKPNANPDKIKEELANINILVEDWGGKFQCQEISAKTGQGIEDLLEKVLLEAEILELKANPEKPGHGTVVEASLDKGRGYVATIMVQAGTLKVGDVLLAGAHFGRVKAMFDHRGKKVAKAGPSTPVLMLGLDGAPQAGDKFNVMESERDAREMANKREQLQREQSMRTKKHITLDEIGRRLAIGSFKELNVIVKGDVDGSIEALSDSLLKLSTTEVQVNIIHKAVGQISESDVLLASASDAIIIGFQVRPSTAARRLAENEEIEIRLYSIIYDAINEIKDAMEGMLAPTVEEVITGNIQVRDVFKITKVGTVAGCYVTDGFIKRNNKVRLVRDGIVVYTGEINQLKRFKEDVAEVKQSYECGLSIKNFHDIQEGDIIEGFTQKEVKRKL